jgi:regulator of protease activity HflC (stomatin/prohibitin superfamily)
MSCVARARAGRRRTPHADPGPNAPARALPQGFVIVPQQRAFVIERLGKYSRTLNAGFYPLIPFFDRIAYVHSLKETALTIPSQAAITKDNVTITLDGVLSVRARVRARARAARGSLVSRPRRARAPRSRALAPDALRTARDAASPRPRSPAPSRRSASRTPTRRRTACRTRSGR